MTALSVCFGRCFLVRIFRSRAIITLIQILRGMVYVNFKKMP